MTDTTGPAFPNEINVDGRLVWNGGLTVRQWYAGMALQGMLAGEGATPDFDLTPFGIAMRAYAIADAMIKEGSK